MITHSQLQFIANIAKIHCVTQEHIQKILESGVIDILFQSTVPVSKDLKDYLRDCLKLPNKDTFAVNYILTVEQMVSAGRYASTKELEEYSVTIPHHNRNDVQLLFPEIIEFSSGTTLEGARKIVNDANLHFATACELLAFSAEFPEIQLGHEILALGTPLETSNPYKKGERSIGYLVAGSRDFSVRSYEYDLRRVLSVMTESWLAPHLISSKKFLAVREV